jgi:hypothetical protein
MWTRAANTVSTVLLLSVLAPASAREPWEGEWGSSPDGGECSEYAIEFSAGVPQDRYFQCDPSRCRSPAGDVGSILERAEADPWSCYITKVTNVRELEAWIFDVECGAEGEIWEARTIAMLTKEPLGLAAYNLGWGGYPPSSSPAVTQLFRCAEAGTETGTR